MLARDLRPGGIDREMRLRILDDLRRARRTRDIGRLLQQRLAEAGCPSPPIHIDPKGSEVLPFDVVVRLKGGRVTLLPAARAVKAYFDEAPHRVLPYLHYLVASGVEAAEFVVDTSDGDQPSLAKLRFSSPHPGDILVPDCIFHASRGYATERQAAEADAVDWNYRRDTIVWRGTCTGGGRVPWAGAALDNAGFNQRVRLCLALRDAPGTDVRISGTDQGTWPMSYFDRLGISGLRRPEREWLGDKYAIDIDGWSNAWSNLLIRMLYGCCVLKVESAFGFRQWYYDRLRPWQHYVPVKADLSDLAERIDWARSNAMRCGEIAAEGQMLAQSLDWAGETARAADTIRANAPRLTTEHADLHNFLAATSSG